MTWFDYLLVAVLVLSIGFAVIRGALREIGTLVVLAIAGVIVVFLIKPLQSALGPAGSLMTTVMIAGALGVVAFTALYFFLHIGLGKLTLSAKAVQADRIAGAAFGLVRGLALVGLGFLAYAYYLDEERRPQAVNRAVTLPIAKAMAGFFEGFAPPDTKLDPTAKPRAPEDATNAALEGYGRGDRAALAEIVTTATSAEGPIVAEHDVGESAGNRQAGGEQAGDVIADILKETDPQ